MLTNTQKEVTYILQRRTTKIDVNVIKILVLVEKQTDNYTHNYPVHIHTFI